MAIVAQIKVTPAFSDFLKYFLIKKHPHILTIFRKKIRLKTMSYVNFWNVLLGCTYFWKTILV